MRSALNDYQIDAIQKALFAAGEYGLASLLNHNPTEKGMQSGNMDLEARSDVIERHKRELVALVGLINTWSARLMSETHVALRLEWDKATTPHTLICGVYLVEDGVQREINGPEFGRLYAIIDEIHAKVSEMKALEIGATLGIHKIASAANPDGRNILAVMEVARRSDAPAHIEAAISEAGDGSSRLN